MIEAISVRSKYLLDIINTYPRHRSKVLSTNNSLPWVGGRVVWGGTRQKQGKEVERRNIQVPISIPNK